VTIDTGGIGSLLAGWLAGWLCLDTHDKQTGKEKQFLSITDNYF